MTDDGYIVYAGYDGKTGLELFQRNNPKLVILDMKLPEISGLELISIFKTSQPTLPVIMISGRPVFRKLERINEEEHNYEDKQIQLANQFINKPFPVEALIKAIEQEFVLLKQTVVGK